MVEQVTGGKALPAEVVQQIVSQDGWGAVVCGRVDQDGGGVGVARCDGAMSVTCPPPLGDSRDLAGLPDGAAGRLATVREIAQLGATIGREFSYELLQAVSL